MIGPSDDLRKRSTAGKSLHQLTSLAGLNADQATNPAGVRHRVADADSRLVTSCVGAFEEPDYRAGVLRSCSPRR